MIESGRFAFPKTSSLMSTDHMDGLAFGTGSVTGLLRFATLRSRQYGTSTSAERTTPLIVKRTNAFRVCWYRLRRCIHRVMASPRRGSQSSSARIVTLFPKSVRQKLSHTPRRPVGTKRWKERRADLFKRTGSSQKIFIRKRPQRGINFSGRLMSLLPRGNPSYRRVEFIESV